MKLILVLVMFLMVSCRSIPYDTTPAPINHNMMTLEMEACGKQEVGLLGCFYEEPIIGELRIPLWGFGEYQIKSERCNYLANVRYSGKQTLIIPFDELLMHQDEQESCLFNVKVFIDGFDNGFEGFFLLSKGDINPIKFKLESKNHEGYAGIQIREGSLLDNYRISVQAEAPGLILWDGCEVDGEKSYTKNPEIRFSEIIKTGAITRSTCILTFGVIPNDKELPVEIGKVHINFYEKTITPLPIPVLKYENELLTVRTDKMVAGIGIGNAWTIKKGNGTKKFTRKVPLDEEVYVRIATSNGRYILLKVKNGRILWIK